MNKKNRKNKERERESIERKRGTKRTTELWGISLFDRNSSVEVGYDFYTIRSKLLKANDMYWVVL